MYARCPICLDFFSSDNVMAVKCGHTFHRQCLIRWIDRSLTCSTCRYPIRGAQDVISLTFEYGQCGPVNDEYKQMVEKIEDTKARLDALKQEMEREAASTSKRMDTLEKKANELKAKVEVQKATLQRLETKLNEFRQKMEEAQKPQQPKPAPIRRPPATPLARRPPIAAASAQPRRQVSAVQRAPLPKLAPRPPAMNVVRRPIAAASAPPRQVSAVPARQPSATMANRLGVGPSSGAASTSGVGQQPRAPPRNVAPSTNGDNRTGGVAPKSVPAEKTSKK